MKFRVTSQHKFHQAVGSSGCKQSVLISQPFLSISELLETRFPAGLITSDGSGSVTSP